MAIQDSYKKLLFKKNGDVEKFISDNNDIKEKDELRSFYFFLFACLKN
jgi:hypothetical protein